MVRIVNDGPMDLFAVGRYLDVYRVQGETVKLRERIVVCDSSRIDTSGDSAVSDARCEDYREER